MGIIGAAITLKGFEDVCKRELESLGAKNAECENGLVRFATKDFLALAKIAYKSQTTSRVMLSLVQSKVSKTLPETENILVDLIKKTDISLWLSKEKTFKVECERNGEHAFTSSEFENMLGRVLIENIEKEKNYRPKVAMDNPDVIIYANIRDGSCVFGVDFCGFDTSKRDYHIFVNKVAIKGTVAACLSLFADIRPKKTVLDTFSSSGTIVIETALMSKGISPNYFRKEEFIFKRLDVLKGTQWDGFFKILDKKTKGKDIRIKATDPILANVRSTTKNAKIATVQKEIECSRVDIEWLDTKIDKKSVDIVVTRLPSVSRSNPAKDVLKLYKEFFYQLEYILKKDGKIIVLLAEDTFMLKVAKEYKFIDTDKRDIMVGKMPLKVITLKLGKGE